MLISQERPLDEEILWIDNGVCVFEDGRSCGGMIGRTPYGSIEVRLTSLEFCYVSENDIVKFHGKDDDYIILGGSDVRPSGRYKKHGIGVDMLAFRPYAVFKVSGVWPAKSFIGILDSVDSVVLMQPLLASWLSNFEFNVVGSIPPFVADDESFALSVDRSVAGKSFAKLQFNGDAGVSFDEAYKNLRRVFGLGMFLAGLSFLSGVCFVQRTPGLNYYLKTACSTFTDRGKLQVAGNKS